MWTPKSDVDLSGVLQIGELAIHRESMERVLAESPQSLKAILDALLEALWHATAHTGAEVRSDVRSEDEAFCVLAPDA